MAEANKKFVRQTRKIRALRPGNLAQWVAGEQPSNQVISTYAKGDVLEIDRETAESLVRGKRAEFIDPKETKEFLEAEKLRLEECVGRGMFLNDRERDEYYRSQAQSPVPSPV